MLRSVQRPPIVAGHLEFCKPSEVRSSLDKRCNRFTSKAVPAEFVVRHPLLQLPLLSSTRFSPSGCPRARIAPGSAASSELTSAMHHLTWPAWMSSVASSQKACCILPSAVGLIFNVVSCMASSMCDKRPQHWQSEQI